MNITQVTVNYGLTYSQSFNGCRVDVSYTATVAEGDDVDQVRAALLAQAQSNCGEAVRQYIESR